MYTEAERAQYSSQVKELNAWLGIRAPADAWRKFYFRPGKRRVQKFLTWNLIDRPGLPSAEACYAIIERAHEMMLESR